MTGHEKGSLLDGGTVCIIAILLSVSDCVRDDRDLLYRQKFNSKER